MQSQDQDQSKGSIEGIECPIKEIEKKEPAHFECSICCNQWKISSRNPQIKCAQCNYIVCKQCQKMYAKAECANCHTGFSHSQITNLLGKPFIRDVIIKNKKEELLQAEKNLIPYTGKLIEYFDKVRAAEEYRGTGKKMELPPRPSITVRTNGTHYPCTRPNCKGYVTIKPQNVITSALSTPSNGAGECCLCKTPHCNICMEHIQSESHTCDPTILSDIAVLEKTTKRCPTCFMRIHKTDGCDHMNCVSCGTHFSWSTGVIMPNRRGGGPNKQLETKKGTMELSANADSEKLSDSVHLLETVINIFSAYRLKHRLKSMETPDETMHLCFTVPKFICMYCIKQEASHHIHSEKLDDLRVMFITNKLNERQWGERLYLLYRKRQLLLQIISILHDFLQKIGLLTISPITKEDPNPPTIVSISMSKTSGLRPDFPFMENSVRIFVEEANVALSTIHQEFHELDTSGEQFYIDPTFQPTSQDVDKLPIFTTRFGKVPDINTNNTMVPAATEKKRTAKKEVAKDGAKENDTEEKQENEVDTEEKEEKQEVNLYPYQVTHYDRMCAILAENEFVIDNSTPGSGKTYTATKYIQNHPFDVILIVCPNSLVTKWKAVQRMCHIKAMVISYTQLIGRLNKHPKHGLLARYDYTNHSKSGRIIANVQYTGTDMFTQMARNQRVCCIFDEIQDMRNSTSLISMASKKIITILHHMSIAVHRSKETEHKFMYLSGTPFDSERNVVTFLQTIGVITRNLFSYNIQTQTNTPDGFEEAMYYYQQLMPTPEEIETNPFEWANDLPIITKMRGNARSADTSAKATPIVFELFRPLIMRRFGTSMIQPAPSNGVGIHVINTYCSLKGESYHLYEKIRNRSIELIRNVDIEQDQEQTTPASNTEIIGNAFELIALLEKCLIQSLVNLAKMELRANPNTKVVIAATFKKAIQTIFEELAEFEPIVLSGDVSADIRHSLIDAFQAPNTAIRVIIGNLSVISTGIDLDDKHGGFPRQVFIFPTYRIMDAYQFNFRFLRGTTTKTSTTIRYLYSDWNLPIDQKELAEDRPGEFIPLSPDVMKDVNDRENIELALFSIVSKKIKVITNLNVVADTIKYSNECIH